MKRLAPLTLLVFAGELAACDPNVVDAVRKPAELPPVDVPTSPVESALIHRYSFDGTGTQVRDAKGAAHGEVIGAELPGFGALPLSGGTAGPYVNLPNGLISPLSDATFEAWVTWTSTAPWQRVFDFGNSASGEDGETGGGTSYLFLTGASGINADRKLLVSAPRAAYSQGGVGDEEPCQGTEGLPVAAPTYLALVVNQARASMTMYLNGEKMVSCRLKRPLSAIDDVNNWLGRSNFAADPGLSGVFDEFRIYSAALTDEEIAESHAAGPDAGI